VTAGPIDHLTLDAIVAFADGEMPMVSFPRAAAHVARCPQCDAEVKAQVVARSWLRSASTPAIPSGLLDTLRSIPVALPAQAEDRAGRDPHGGTAARHRPPSTDPHLRSAHRSRRFRFLGAGALVAGLTVGALVGADAAGDPDGHPESPQIAHVSPATGQTISVAGLGTP
jgi:anti-sigma factor RsiW